MTTESLVDRERVQAHKDRPGEPLLRPKLAAIYLAMRSASGGEDDVERVSDALISTCLLTQGDFTTRDVDHLARAALEAMGRSAVGDGEG